MDILNRISISTRIVFVVGLLLVVALTVVVLQRNPEVKPQPLTTSKSPMSPTNAEPSKENVSKQVQERINHLKDIVAKQPSDSRSSIELARTLQDGHDMQGALKYYEIGLRADPRNIEARVDYSLCLYQAGKEQEAFVQNAVVLQQDASNVQALYNIGAVYANRGMNDSAAYYWRSLIAAHPNDDLAQKATQNLKQLAGKKPAL
jgi:cytochrome c-type biogenesis protein CcmH/NrfG